MNKKGFTLAEILITIGVIGVVAAITIPTLIKNYQKLVMVHRLKMAYTIFSQAVQMSIEENGDPSSWTVYSETFLSTYINPYLKSSSEIKPYYIYTLSSLKSGKNIYTQLLFHSNKTKTFQLNNGISYSFTTQPNWGGPSYRIYVDLNGSQEPNILGKDVFAFIVTLDKGLRTLNYNCTYKELTGETLIDWNGCGGGAMSNYCNINNNSGYYSGQACAALIEKSGWKIPKDYPW